MQPGGCKPNTKGLQFGWGKHPNWDVTAICIAHPVSKIIFCLPISYLAQIPAVVGWWPLAADGGGLAVGVRLSPT